MIVLMSECELHTVRVLMPVPRMVVQQGRVSFPSPQKDPDWDGPPRGGLKRWWTLDTMTNPLNTVATVYTVDSMTNPNDAPDKPATS